jgi:hypothetical protein
LRHPGGAGAGSGRALTAGLIRAQSLIAAGRIRAAALHLQGRTVTTGPLIRDHAGSGTETKEAIAAYA